MKRRSTPIAPGFYRYRDTFMDGRIAVVCVCRNCWLQFDLIQETRGVWKNGQPFIYICSRCGQEGKYASEENGTAR